MSRRNKKGQRARGIGDGPNAGIIVLVMRPYFYPQKFDGCTWVGFRFPWVVTSMGRQLQYSHTDGSPCAPVQSGVLDDENLEPLDDDDFGPEEANARYFTGRTDGLYIRPMSNLLKARVGSGSESERRTQR